MIGVVRIDPDVMVVNVLGFLTKTPQGFAAIVRDHQKNIHDVNAIDVLRIGDDARVVHRRRVEFVALFPTAAAIARAEDAALFVRRFNGRVDDIGINRRDRQADAAHICRRQTGPHLIPGGAGIRRFVDRALRPPSIKVHM